MRIIVLVVLLFCQVVFGWLSNLPQEAGIDVPEGKLNSLSFAPYRENQGPFDGIFPSVAQVSEDLQLMADKTHTIRTYASYEGTMPAIPPLAQKYGLTMIQGAWISDDTIINEKEINALIKAANNYPDVVKRVIVGNEALMRGEITADKLIDYIHQVKQKIKQPVSYADVWSIYMKNPQLIKEVDYITIHILPYWEDEPIHAQEAPEHIERIFKLVKKEMESLGVNKPILIGETGWPSMGRQRGWAVPTIVNEASVVRSLLDVAKRNGFDVNIVEALNQPWKSELEGVVGANWGLFSKDRKEVFPLTGKVYEHPQWFKNLSISLGLVLLITVLSWQVLKELSLVRMVLFLVFAQVLSTLLVNQYEFLWYTSYRDWQRQVTLLIVLLSALLEALVLRRSLQLLTEHDLKLPACLAKMQSHNLNQNAYSLIIVFACYAFYQSYLLTFYGRYISFPIVPCCIAVVGLLGLLVITCFVQQRWTLKNIELNRLLGYENHYAAQNRILGYFLAVLIIGVIIGEIRGFIFSGDFILAYPDLIPRLGMATLYTFCNLQLVTWLLCLVILSLSLLVADKSSLAKNDWLSRLAYHNFGSGQD